LNKSEGIVLAKKSEAKSANRFGPRYGRTLRLKLGKVEAEYYRKKLKCPYCHYQKVKRVALGIWKCSKCGAEFAASAYSIEKKNLAEEVKEESE